MTPRPTFSETVAKLVKAYFNDELKHGDCSACVVGNLCGGDKSWGALFITGSSGVQCRSYEKLECTYYGKGMNIDFNRAMVVVESTGYSVHELADIEHAFETADLGKTEDDWMFNGLMDVVDVLADIHGIDLIEKEEAKAMFQKC